MISDDGCPGSVFVYDIERRQRELSSAARSCSLGSKKNRLLVERARLLVRGPVGPGLAERDLDHLAVPALKPRCAAVPQHFIAAARTNLG